MRTRAILIESFDDVPHLGEREVPTLAADQVLIRVHASSVNAFDWKAAEGRFKDMFEYEFPVTIGRDYAGVVEQVGSSVERVAVGDAVLGYFTGQRLGRGAFADYVWCGEDECFVAKPESLPFPEAACLPLCGIVGSRCVDAVAPEEGELHLVLGAPGGVGSYCVQWVAARGAHVIASGLPEDEAYLRGLGATEVVDQRGDVVDELRARHPEGIDGLIDLVHYKPAFLEHAALLRRGGRVASTHRGADPEGLEPLGVTGTNVGSFPDAELLARIASEAASGKFRTPIRRTFRLEEVPLALDLLKNEHAHGRFVVSVLDSA
jgi:NADPH:quinone reductase